MIQGHGDDAYRFERPIRANFSSNVYAHVDLEPLKAHLRESLESIGRYPEPEPYTLEARLAARLGIPAATLCVTSGATEAIYLTAQAFSGARSAVLQPTFNEYADACRLYGHSVADSVRSRGSSSYPSGGTDRGKSPALPDKLSPALHGRPDLLWFCNPNNPTGTVIPKDELQKAIAENPGTIFVMDQSYGFFTREPLLSAAEAVRYPNVIQIHSMTKRYAVPGLRLGYLVASEKLIERIRAVRRPWSVGALAIEGGLYLADHPDAAPINLPALLQEAERLQKALDALPGLQVEPTCTHFFLCRLEKGSAAELKSYLAENQGILIRDASNFVGLDEHCFRIATQTPAENDALVAAVGEWLKTR